MAYVSILPFLYDLGSGVSSQALCHLIDMGILQTTHLKCLEIFSEVLMS